jgi:hypothetical protein
LFYKITLKLQPRKDPETSTDKVILLANFNSKFKDIYNKVCDALNMNEIINPRFSVAADLKANLVLFREPLGEISPPQNEL